MESKFFKGKKPDNSNKIDLSKQIAKISDKDKREYELDKRKLQLEGKRRDERVEQDHKDVKEYHAKILTIEKDWRKRISVGEEIPISEEFNKFGIKLEKDFTKVYKDLVSEDSMLVKMATTKGMLNSGTETRDHAEYVIRHAARKIKECHDSLMVEYKQYLEIENDKLQIDKNNLAYRNEYLQQEVIKLQKEKDNLKEDVKEAKHNLKMFMQSYSQYMMDG